MSTVRDLATSIWLAIRLAVAALLLGAQLFYIVGPLVIGAFVTLFGFAVIARYLVWPVARGTMRLIAAGVRRLIAAVTPTPAPKVRQGAFAHPVA
jgi:hypothetical protein